MTDISSVVLKFCNLNVTFCQLRMKNNKKEKSKRIYQEVNAVTASDLSGSRLSADA